MPLSRSKALRLLGEAEMGRVVFTEKALPEIRPVNHLLAGDDIVIRTHLGAAILGQARTGAVVAYEVDAIDPAERRGWSVIVIGEARLVTDPDQVKRYRELLRPWVRGQMDEVIAIRVAQVKGFALVDGAATPVPGEG